MSPLAVGALLLFGLGAVALLAELRQQVQRQDAEIFALRSAEFVRSADAPAKEDQITRLRRLRQTLFSSGASTIADRGEQFSLDEINQRLGALGVV
jgi:hypothetical protein